MELTPYLSFNGQCEAAFKFYEKALSGKITFIMTYGDSPMAGETPDDWRGKIMHATLTLKKGILQGADAAPGHGQKAQGFCLSLSMADPAEAERIFKCSR